MLIINIITVELGLYGSVTYMMYHISHGRPLDVVHEFNKFGKFVCFFSKKFKIVAVGIWVSSDFSQSTTNVTANNGALI